MSWQQLICNTFGKVRQKNQRSVWSGSPIMAISRFDQFILLIYYHFNNKTENILPKILKNITLIWAVQQALLSHSLKTLIHDRWWTTGSHAPAHITKKSLLRCYSDTQPNFCKKSPKSKCSNKGKPNQREMCKLSFFFVPGVLVGLHQCKGRVAALKQLFSLNRSPLMIARRDYWHVLLNSCPKHVHGTRSLLFTFGIRVVPVAMLTCACN